MAWYPAQKIIYNGLVPISIDIRAIAMFHIFISWPQLRMPEPVHSFGYNMELYHSLVPSLQGFKVHIHVQAARCYKITKSENR